MKNILDRYRNYQEAIENIDWNLLEQQKKTLEKLLISFPLYVKTSHIPDENIFNLWELIEFIENLQDMHKDESLGL